MSNRSRNFIALWTRGVVVGIPISCCLSLLLCSSHALWGRDTNVSQNRLSLSYIDNYYATLKPGDMAALRDSTDVIIASSLFQAAPVSIRDRVFNAELNYRNGQEGLTNDTIADAVNAFGATTSLPGFVQIGPQHVQALRMKLLRYFPHLLGSSPVSGAVEYKTISPAGGFLLADMLLRQELMNPEFKSNPDQWAAKYSESTSNQAVGAAAPTLVARPMDPNVASFIRRLHTDMGTGSATLAALTRFLDKAGF
jgi:hypothetical protein